MKLAKAFALILGIASTFIVVVGFFLPRRWSVQASLEIPNESKSKAFEMFSDFKKWNQWAIGDPSDESYIATFSETTQVVGSWIKWESKKSGRGKLTLTQLDENQFIRYEGMIESNEKNSSGEIFLESTNTDNGKSKVVWKDEGTLPPVIGGYFKPLFEASLQEHFQKSLEKLASLL